MRRKICVFILCIYYFTSAIYCKNTIDLRNAKDFSSQIIEKIGSGKIVFIGEKHSDIRPILLLTKNLESFYKAGVRYIFLEEEEDYYLDENCDLNIFIYPPWGTWGQKYEYLLFEKEIKRLNEKYKNDPFVVIWPETEYDFYSDPLKYDMYHVLNMRDSTSQNKIIEIMDSTDKKGLILYGDGHGIKTPQYDDEKKCWYPLGSYLDEHYGNAFITYKFFGDFSSDSTNKVIYNNENDCKILPEILIDKWVNEYNFINEYDYYCVYNQPVWGIPNSYISNSRIIKYMFSLFPDKSIINENSFIPNDKKSEQLLALYYLKYHLQNNFEFNWQSNSKEDLYEILSNSENKIENSYSVDTHIKELEQYSKFLYSYGIIEDYLLSPKNDERIDYVLNNMKQARKINNKDIWPQYWLSYFKTENAIYSEKKSDYKEALKEWEKLLKNELLYASPVLKLTYRKIAFCAEKIGNLEKQQIYLQKEKQVSDLLDFDYEKYIYFGY